MTADALKKRVMEEFDSLGLLTSLNVETSAFSELPRFFESSRLSMRLVLDDVGSLAEAGLVAANIKRELEPQGVELEYEIRVQWKVAGLYSDALEHGADADCMPSELFYAELESGMAKRSVAIHVSAEAKTSIRQYLGHIAPAHQQSAIYKLLETCLNQKLSSLGDECWNPILYPSWNIEVQDIAPILECRVDSREQELVPGT